MKARFINPFTDFGFKKIFGEEASKPMLIDFLNAVLPEKDPIINITFKNTEQLGINIYDRKAVYDIYCDNDKGEKFIVELQKAKQNYFKERTIYYSTFPIREQAEKGDWNYNLKAVYCIGILDFTFDDYEQHENKNDVLHTIKLKNQYGSTFYDKLTYLYIEMPNFNKQENELSTRLDKWLYFIKNLEDFQTIPHLFKDAIFENAFEKAELAKLNITEYDQYEQNLKIYRDNKNVVDYAYEEGKEKGREKGREEGREEGKEKGIKETLIKIIQNADTAGLSLPQIISLTGLTEDEILEIKNRKS
jgi:predicted transposase/invertase (TIGR01784 family)